MKKLMLLVLFFGMAPIAEGEVSTRVCLADGNTPLECRDIMVGTKLTIIVNSNAAEYWDGSLALMGEDVNRAELSARGPLQFGSDWSGSHLEAAGPMAAVYNLINEGILGFDLYTDYSDIEIGDWFIIDYNAIDIGNCNVAFFDGIDYDPPYEPTSYIEFTHVRTRDFDGSTKVDFSDFAMLALYWQEKGCNEPNWCEGTDLDTSGTVDTNDLMLFADYWLERTE
jgi:hypothetical protein